MAYHIILKLQVVSCKSYAFKIFQVCVRSDYVNLSDTSKCWSSLRLII